MKFDRILFLDIDGVLTSEKRNNALSKCSEKEYMLDKICLQNFEELFRNVPGLKVVIHSSWIKHKDNPEAIFHYKGQNFRSLLPEVISWLKSNNVYLDCVPYMKATPKRKKIDAWITLNQDILKALSKCRFLVVDDDSGDWNELQEINRKNYSNYRYLQINSLNGFKSSNLKEAINFLNKGKIFSLFR